LATGSDGGEGHVLCPGRCGGRRRERAGLWERLGSHGRRCCRPRRTCTCEFLNCGLGRSSRACCAGAYLHGALTRKVDDLVKALVAETGIFVPQVCRTCADVDVKAMVFRDRLLAATVPCMPPQVRLVCMTERALVQPGSGLPSCRPPAAARATSYGKSWMDWKQDNRRSRAWTGVGD
jgi:hypothetical protein